MLDFILNYFLIYFLIFDIEYYFFSLFKNFNFNLKTLKAKNSPLNRTRKKFAVLGYLLIF